MVVRIGHGFDTHRFQENVPLILGGVNIPHTHGMAAHSDGDVVLHALVDAILGALALGDIGQHFSNTDSKWADADSRLFLTAVYQMALDKGYVLANADVSIEAEAPKLAPHITGMREVIASCLNVAIDQVSVKATTTEKMGYVGREEGIAAHAVVLLVSS